jgi:L-fuconolactonase
MTETILEPDLPIIDPHHHLWDLRPIMGAFPEPLHPFIASVALTPYYTFDQLHADTHSGHNVISTVFMECGAWYRAGADDALKVVGEVEFVNGVAAQGASGLYGDYRPCAAIIGHADLRLGSEAGRVLDALSAASSRFCGIRHQGAWDADPEVLGPPFHAPSGLYADSAFRTGFAELGKRGLTFDAWVLEPQIAEVTALARAFPDQQIVLDHCGCPSGSPFGVMQSANWRPAPMSRSNWADSPWRSADCQRKARLPGYQANISPHCGGPMSKPASKPSVPIARCLKATTRWTNGARAMRCCGIPSSA